jgi:hypothetical protein
LSASGAWSTSWCAYPQNCNVRNSVSPLHGFLGPNPALFAAFPPAHHPIAEATLLLCSAQAPRTKKVSRVLLKTAYLVSAKVCAYVNRTECYSIPTFTDIKAD